MTGPKTAAGNALHAMKYRGENEDFREATHRFCFAVKEDDKHYHELREIQLDMRFLPPGRAQSAMGARRETTPWNCFVSGTIPDSFVNRDNPEQSSIMHRAEEAAATMRMGGGIGYDFSTLRPRGDAIRKLQSTASGPVSFMNLFNEVGLATASSGHRRGAQMAVMRVDHPDIEEFIRSKQNSNRLTGFNISVGVTNEFMEAVYAKKEFDLRWGGRVYASVNAEELYEMIMRSNWEWSEPGMLFLDQINEMNNLWYCETIAATNPCGEQPLPPFGACLLGSFNLVRYLKKHDGLNDASHPLYYFDFDLLAHDIPIVVRAMDNIIDRGRYPLPRQKAEGVTKRRMGLGITGLANTGEALGFTYGSPKFIEFMRLVLETIRNCSYFASANLAQEKGTFPLFDAELYARGKFFATLPDFVQDHIKRHGLRNSHLTSIAPTGTISMCADNVSAGLEPVLFHEADRTINTPDGPQSYKLQDYGVGFLGIRGRLAHEVTPDEHVAVLNAATQCVDSAVSKTVNVDSRFGYHAFRDLYSSAHRGGAKGLTTYNSDGQRGSIFTQTNKDNVPEGAKCELDPVTGRRECG